MFKNNVSNHKQRFSLNNRGHKFSCKGNVFLEIFRKDIYNQEELSKLGLNKRQIKAVLYVRENGKITNSEFKTLNGCSRNTASADLTDLVEKQILRGSEMKGAGAYYQLY